MLNALLLVAALSAGPNYGTLVVGTTSVIKSEAKLVDTPKGKRHTWRETKATVVVIDDFDEDDKPIPSAVAVMRPEKPAKSFSMMSVFVGAAEGREIDSDSAGAAIGFDYSSNDMGAQLCGLIEKGKLEALDAYAGDAIKVNPNLDLRSGGWTRRTYVHDIRYLDVRVRIESRTMIDGEPEPEWTPLDSLFIGSYEWHVPRSGAWREEFFPDAEKALPEQVPYYGIPDDGKWGMPGGTFTIPLPQPGNGGTAPGDYRDQIDKVLTKPIGIQISPGFSGSMNEISYPAADTMPGWSASLPPGTLWYPDAPGYQIVSNTSMLAYGIGSASGPQTVRINCMNMSLKEPNGKVKYFPMANPDPVSMAIMNMAPLSTRTMAPTQTRTWIFTDKANLAEINKKLEPDVDAGQYLSAVYQVFSAGGLTEPEISKKGMADASLLPEASAKKEAVKWLMGRLTKSRSKDVSAWLEGRPELLLLLFEQTNAAYGDRGQWLLNELLDSPKSDIRIAALKLMDGLAPSALPHLENRLPNLRFSVLSGQKLEAELAWKVTKKYSQTLPKWVLEMLATSKASPVVAAEARARLGE